MCRHRPMSDVVHSLRCGAPSGLLVGLVQPADQLGVDLARRCDVDSVGAHAARDAQSFGRDGGSQVEPELKPGRARCLDQGELLFAPQDTLVFFGATSTSAPNAVTSATSRSYSGRNGALRPSYWASTRSSPVAA